MEQKHVYMENNYLFDTKRRLQAKIKLCFAPGVTLIHPLSQTNQMANKSHPNQPKNLAGGPEQRFWARIPRFTLRLSAEDVTWFTSTDDKTRFLAGKVDLKINVS